MNDTSEVKLHFLDYWRTIKVRAGLVVLTFLLVMVTAGVTTYFLPREFFSKVTMEVRPDNSGPLGGGVFGGGGRGGMDPMFVPTQFQILQKKEILYPVIDSLKLVETWSSEGRKMTAENAYMKLVRMMELREVRNTGLIEIGIYSTDAQEAANIANTVAVIYRETRLKQLQDGMERALSQLKDELDRQRKVVDDSAIEMAKVRERDNIVDQDPESATAIINRKDRDIPELEKQINEKRLRVTQLKGQFDAITRMKPEELREVLRTLNIEDQTVNRMVQSLQDATAKEAELAAGGLGENHPQLKAVRSQKEVYLKTLADQLESVRRNQATQLEIEQGVLGDLEIRFTEAQKLNIEDKKMMSAYVEAKTRYIQAKKIHDAAQIKLSTEQIDRRIDFDPSKIWERAEKSSYWARPNVAMIIFIAAVVGAIVGIGLAFFIEYLDTSVKTIEDVEKHLQVPVLAVVPKNVHVLMNTEGDTADAEIYRIMRANVEFNKPTRNANTITVVSGGPGEGKSTTLNNLAFVCAQGGYHVLVIDADLRRPSQHRFFDIDHKHGLVDYLKGEATIDEITRPTKLDNLSFIPSGRLPENSVGILNSQRMVEFIAKVKTQYDLVFFDAPPILGVSDGSVLSSECEITIMVIQHRRFPRAMLQRVKQAVVQAGGKLIGVVLNNVDSKHDEGYYSAYNDYYAKPVRDAKPAKAPATPAAPRRAAKPAPEPQQSPVPAPVTANGGTAQGLKPRSADEEDY
ncbi:MAG: polysaccharide biosynthesis tyrosine autokinase [Chthoniobacteraceae bacterium]